MTIPNIIHFVFGFKEQTEEFLYAYYLAIWSASVIHKPEQILFHYHHEPYGKWWNEAKKLVTLCKTEIPTAIDGVPIKKFAHAADVTRMRVLLEQGGIYLDMDTISCRPLTHLFDNEFVMGVEEGVGLANAIMLAEPGAKFLSHWLSTYTTVFNPDGWEEASVRYPLALSLNPELSSHIKIVNKHYFFDPSWREIPRIFETCEDVHPDLHVMHLWETHALPYMRKIDPAWLRANPHTLYAKIWRRVVTASKTVTLPQKVDKGKGKWKSNDFKDLMESSMEAAFTKICKTKAWGCEHPSGHGSLPEATLRERAALETIIDRCKIDGLIDAPCGQFSWIESIAKNVDYYMGIEIVEDLVRENERLHGKDCVFIQGNLVESFPKNLGDVQGKTLIFCRDLTQHLSKESTFKVLGNFINSGDDFLAITNYHVGENTETPEWKNNICHSLDHGAFRKQNYLLAPYYLPEPEDKWHLKEDYYLYLYDITHLRRPLLPKQLAFRYDAVREVLNFLNDLPDRHIVTVETGSQRQALTYDVIPMHLNDDHPFKWSMKFDSVPYFGNPDGSWSCWADGASTSIFDAFHNHRKMLGNVGGGHHYSLDINRHGIKTSEMSSAIIGDSHDTLASLKVGQIDVLLLDSYDVDPANPHPSALHHLQEFELIVNSKDTYLDGLLVIDDNWMARNGRVHGKGMYIIKFMQYQRIRPLCSGYIYVYHIDSRSIDKDALTAFVTKCMGS